MIEIICDFPQGLLKFTTCEYSGSEGHRKSIVNIAPLSMGLNSEKSIEISSLTIEFSDVDRFFKKMMRSEYRYIKDKTVQVFRDAVLLFAGEVFNYSFKNNLFILEVNNPDTLSKTMFPTESITKTEFPGCGDNSGKTIPIIYGIHSSEKGAIPVMRVDADLFLICGHNIKSIDTVYDPEETEITGNWTLDNTQANRAFLRFDTGTAPDYPELYINCHGKTKSNEVITHPIDALTDVISFTALQLNPVQLEIVRNTMINRNYQFSYCFNKAIKITEFFYVFSFSFDTVFNRRPNGIIDIRIYDYQDISPKKTFDENQIGNIDLDPEAENYYSEVKYMYDYVSHGDYFKNMPRVERPSQWGYQYTPLDCRYAADDITAKDAALRFLVQHKEPPIIYKFDLTLRDLGSLNVCDIIYVYHNDTLQGTEEKAVLMIYRIRIDLLQDRVSLETIDVKQLSGQMFRVGDCAVLPQKYTEATEEQKGYFYLCDQNTGNFSNGDPGKKLY